MRPRQSRALVLALVLALVSLGACEAHPEARGPIGPSKMVVPACPHGAFAAELDRHLPALAPTGPIPIFAASKLDPRLEPGCVLPFRDQPGIDEERDAGRVLVRLTRRTTKEGEQQKPVLLGRGALRIGRGRLHLEAHDDSGDVVLVLAVEGHVVDLAWKNHAKLAGEISVDGSDPLPLPLDALVAALDRCDADRRLGASADGDFVEARRGGHLLWRTRYLEADRSFAIDTSTSCDDTDARFAWRTAAGDTLPMLVLASVRSDVTLLIERQSASFTEDINDPAMSSGAH